MKIKLYLINFVCFALIIFISKCFAHYSTCKIESEIKFRDSYDFVIVGAGSAGSVVANRLSEDSDVTVLLLEAGGEPNAILNEVPMLQSHLRGSEQDWNFFTEAQTAPFFRNHSNRFSVPRGKVLGGSSSINGMGYLRGHRKDYEAWNDQADGGWSWEEVLHFFKKSEDIEAPNVDRSYHGKGGCLTVSESDMRHWSTDMFLKAADDIGWMRTDINGENQNGVMPIQYTIRNGARCSTHKAFLLPAYHRSNLHIVTYAYVHRVLLETKLYSKPKAIGVQFQCGDLRLIALASKEVILSAGAFQSPQLLLLSGIGPREQLEHFNITSIVHLPGVGENLGDHVGLANIFFVSDELKERGTCPLSNDFQAQLVEWSFNRTGSLTLWGAPNLIGNYQTSNDLKDWPQIQLVLHKTHEETFAARYVFSAFLTLLRPKSRGMVSLESADPLAPPKIDPRYFDDKRDLDELVKAIDFLITLNNTKALKDSGIELKIKKFPACANYTEYSKKHLTCFVQEMATSGWHFVGTCKLGNEKDPMAVVDSELRVFYVSRLRVIDASIMPSTPSGNTNAPTIMVGERGSDFIKKYWIRKSMP